MMGREAQARSDELAARLGKEFGLDRVEAEFVVLVGRSGGMFIQRQAEVWREGRALPAAGPTVWRWINGPSRQIGRGVRQLSLWSARARVSVQVHQFVGRKVYAELGMDEHPLRACAADEGRSTIVEIKRRLVSVGAVLARWWYPWLGSVEASVSWCDALGIDRAVLPQTRYGTGGKKKPELLRGPLPARRGGQPLSLRLPAGRRGEGREQGGSASGAEATPPSGRPWAAWGVHTTVVVARSAQTLSVPVADVMSGWEASGESHRAVRGIWFDTQLDYVLAGNAPAVLEAHGGPEGVARRRRELAEAIEAARTEVVRGVAKTEELVLEEVPA